jgi:hypothetical protein
MSPLSAVVDAKQLRSMKSRLMNLTRFSATPFDWWLCWLFCRNVNFSSVASACMALPTSSLPPSTTSSLGAPYKSHHALTHLHALAASCLYRVQMQPIGGEVDDDEACDGSGTKSMCMTSKRLTSAAVCRAMR